MGFKAPRTVYKLVFDDEDYEGLVVRAKAMTLGEQKAWLTLSRDSEVVEFFAPFLIDWNLTNDNDEPIPATAEGIAELEVPFMQKIVDAWTMAGIRVANPLAKPSRDGELEESIPMEVSSPSLAS